MALEDHNSFSLKDSRVDTADIRWREMVRTTVVWVRCSANQAALWLGVELFTRRLNLRTSKWHQRKCSSLCLAVRNEPVKTGPGSLTPGLPTVLPAAKPIAASCRSRLFFDSGALATVTYPIV